MSRHFRPLGALASVVVGIMLAVGAVAGPVAAEPDYPTWDDVQNARQNEAATAAEVAKIEAFLVELEANATAANRDAMLKAEAYNVARIELDAANARFATLDEQAASAADRAAVSATKAGQLVAQLARTAGGDVTLSLLLSADADDLLNQLGTMSKVSEQASGIYRLAIVDRNLSQSLTDQAEVAAAERDAIENDAAETLVGRGGRSGGRERARRRAAGGVRPVVRPARDAQGHDRAGRAGIPRRRRGPAAAPPPPVAAVAAVAAEVVVADHPHHRPTAASPPAAIAFAYAAARRTVRVRGLGTGRLGLLGTHQGRVRLGRRLHRHALGHEPVLDDGQPGPPRLVHEP